MRIILCVLFVPISFLASELFTFPFTPYIFSACLTGMLEQICTFLYVAIEITLGIFLAYILGKTSHHYLIKLYSKGSKGKTVKTYLVIISIGLLIVLDYAAIVFYLIVYALVTNTRPGLL